MKIDKNTYTTTTRNPFNLRIKCLIINLVIEIWCFHIMKCFKINFKQRVKMSLKRLIACIYLWTALNRTLLYQYSRYHCQKESNYVQWLKNYNCITENLPFDCEFSKMKEVVDGALYHATQIT